MGCAVSRDDRESRGGREPRVSDPRAGRKTRRGIRRGTRGDGRGSDRTGDAGAGKGASGPTLRPISVPGSSRTHLGVETRSVVPARAAYGRAH